MRIKETKVYPFSELSETAQEKAVELLSSINVDHDFWEFIYEDAKTIGLKITSFDLDRNRHAKGQFIFNAEKVIEGIKENHGKDCETYKTAIEYEKTLSAFSEDQEDERETVIEEFLKSLLEDYSIILQHESEYLQSRESIVETIKANEYEFTEDGKLS